MLTKQDLTAIGKLIDNRLGTRISPMEKNIKGMQKNIQGIQADTQEIKKSLKKVEKNVKKLRKDFTVFSKRSDETLQKTRNRVDRIEDHLKLPPFS